MSKNLQRSTRPKSGYQAKGQVIVFQYCSLGQGIIFRNLTPGQGSFSDFPSAPPPMFVGHVVRLADLSRSRLMTMSPMYSCGKSYSTGTCNERVKKVTLFFAIINGVMMETRDSRSQV